MRLTRSALTVAAAVVAGVAFGASETIASTKVDWNFSTWGPPREFTAGMQTVADYVKEQSGGNFTITLHHGEVLGPSREQLDGLSIGAFEAASSCMSYHPGKNPLGTALDLPFLPLEQLEVVREVHEAYGNEFEPYVKEMQGWNARMLFSGILPQYELLGRGNPPKTLEDFRGMRVRALGGQGDAFRRLGAVPTTVPAPEIYQSLERGVLQANSQPFTYAQAAYRLHEIADWFTSNLSPGTVFCPFLVNIAAYEKLPSEYQQMLIDAKPAAYETLITGYHTADEKWLPIFRERMTEIVYSDEEIARFREAAGQSVWDEWIKDKEDRGMPGQAAVDFILEKAEEAAAALGS